jgi:hypothetical protein
MYRFIFIFIITALTFCSCDKEKIPSNPVSQREVNYDNEFERLIGKASEAQCWGDWQLDINAQTRDDSGSGDYAELVYPSSDEIIDAVNVLHEYYDGINTIYVPSGDYWAVTIYKNDYVMYTDLDFYIKWFKAYEKMSGINVYGYNERKYNKIESIDSLVLIKDIGGYDGVIPQFSYFNELYNENYFDYRTIERAGVYYIGFDFYIDGFINNSLNITTGKDCIYDDWVIMLIPAIKYGEDIVIDEKRVMCEDLSTTPDFDFNDLVYDVAIVNTKGSLKTRVIIQAVGTTTSVDFLGKEAHTYFGMQSGNCINTGGSEGKIRKDPVVLYLDDVIVDIRDIDASVFYENKIYFLNAPIGKPTRKICVDCSTKWCYGNYGIWLVYPLFGAWAEDPTVEWVKNPRKELLFNGFN